MATEWLTAIAAADPEDLTGAVDRLGIEFTDLADDELTSPTTTCPKATTTRKATTPEATTPKGTSKGTTGQRRRATATRAAPPETVEELPEDDHGLGRSFDEDVEAEVAELLGETEAPPATEALPASRPRSPTWTRPPTSSTDI